MAKLVIFGSGDIARLADYYFSHHTEHDVVAFVVDGAYRDADVFLDRPFADFEMVEATYPPDRYQMFVALSYAQMNRLRAERYSQAKAKGYTLAGYVSPRCTFLTDEPIGDNCFILEDNTVQPFVTIGSDVTFWSGNHIGHDSVIEDHCFVSSHVVVAGHVEVGAYCFLGVNSTLAHGVKVAPHTLVGAGAVITKDTTEGAVYVPPRSVLVPKRSDEVVL